MDGRLTAGHARALLGLPSRQEQDQLANRAIKENLTVREVEKIVRDGSVSTKGTKKRSVKKSVAELEVKGSSVNFFPLVWELPSVVGEEKLQLILPTMMI